MFRAIAFVAFLSITAAAVAQPIEDNKTAEDGERQPLTKQQLRHAAMTEGGDAEAGKDLFLHHPSLNCRQCHRVSGKEMGGPNLEGVGDKFTREQLITQILEPSEEIKPGFEQTNILTVDGRVLTGRLERATKDHIRLINNAGENVSVAPKQVETMVELPTSMMPADSVAVLSADEFRDLVRYMESLTFGEQFMVDATGESVPIDWIQQRAKLSPIHPASDRFENPVDIKAVPGQDGSLVILEHQTGKIWRYQPNTNPPTKELFLDLGNEIHFSLNQGLMCIAFHPEYTDNGRYFLEHEVKEDGVVKTLIVERTAAEDRLRDSGEPSRRLLELEQPAFNHNGGCIAFGPDGMLYAGFGDGGPQKDPPGHSQNLAVLLGTMIRIDVDADQRPYGIPADNPFADYADDAALPEIWAYGFREPWRFSFDQRTGQLYVGDVGQWKFEEVCLVRGGENHGWNVREGHSVFSTEYQRDDAVYTAPLLAIPHGIGFSVTGGYVYYGTQSPHYHGAYIFGDYATRQIWSMRHQGDRVTELNNIGEAADGIASFGIDHRGELLVVTYDGNIYRLELPPKP